jgi:hypothetical protein
MSFIVIVFIFVIFIVFSVEKTRVCSRASLLLQASDDGFFFFFFFFFLRAMNTRSFLVHAKISDDEDSKKQKDLVF